MDAPQEQIQKEESDMYTSLLPTPHRAPPAKGEGERRVRFTVRDVGRHHTPACHMTSYTPRPRVAEVSLGKSRNLAAETASGRKLGRDLRRRFEAIRLTINGCVNFAGEINGCAAPLGGIPYMVTEWRKDMLQGEQNCPRL